MPAPRVTAKHSPHWVLLICCLTVIFDGYDLIVYGTIVPDLLAHKEWDLTPAEVGHIGSVTLVGMLIGALGVGTITDVLGRRKVMIGCLVWFSVAMPVTALAPDPTVFMLLRFVTGLGLGGVVPTAIALTMEYSPEGRRQLNNSLMFSGYSVGGVLAALLALWLLPVAGFRAMFVVGVVPLFLVLPLALRMLPESIAYLTAKGRLDEAAMYARRFGVSGPGVPGAGGETAAPAPAASGRAGGVLDILRTLFGGRRLAMTLLVWAISIMGLLLVYGLNTWLPQFMRGAGYSMGSALTFLLVFNLGAVAGVIIAGALADKLGEKLVIACSFCLAAVAVCLFITKPSTVPLLMVGALAGFGSNTQTLVNAFIGGLYPPTARATALGWALGIGRIGGILGPTYGGYVLTKVETGSLGDNWVFYAFAVPAVLAAVLTALVPRRPWTPPPTAATGPPVPAARDIATGA
ncbi:aromatic acid/H+ symport family MFS transporter [Streptomyces sp. SID8352]|uniref:MFS transporter n=1 Tax=Streptomyces sp. SID8352 TaxID=2690338 RepID=UPI0013699BF3|nr:aromatic acid/H+ symport family MFS transporter [Streptomyces sp. SID8352]MYU22690.1 MFS transporter [Streptomyces sp. SID8352]